MADFDELTLAILDGCESPLCVLDASGHVQAASRGAERVLGIARHQLAGCAILSLLGFESHGDVTRSLHDEAPGGDVLELGPAQWQRPDGRILPIRCRIRHTAKPGCRLLMIEPDEEDASGKFCDIESGFRAILDTITDCVVVIDDYGIIQLSNPATELLFGYRRDELIGQNVKMLMPSPDSEQHDTYLDNYRRTGVGQIIGVGREVLGRRKGGALFPLYLSIGELQEGGDAQIRRHPS